LSGALRRWTAGTLATTVAALAAAALVGGCDWFDDPVAANLPPWTELTDCPSARNVQAGDDVTIEWTGDDPDGDVDHYEWSYGSDAGADTSGVTDEESITIEGVAEGDHLFEVAAVDDEDAVDPNPATCEFTAVSGGGELVPRVVLVEYLTNQFCPNCPNGEEALQNLIDQYGPDELTVIAYHYSPPPDAVATTETIARCDVYFSAHGIPPTAFPVAVFDGLRTVLGAPTVASAEEDYAFEIDLRRDVGSPITVDLTGSIEAGRGSVAVKVKVHSTLSGASNVVRIAVFEDDVPEHVPPYEFVVRNMLDDAPLTISAVGDSVVVERDIVVDPSWNVNNLGVIAFVQDDTTLEIIQSGRLLNE